MGDNELWQAFLFEVTEQLEHLEKELIHAKANDAEIINQLFRYFHSIKSSCAMFEFAAMEAIAHAAESVLDQIRKGVMAVNDDVVAILLASVDCLKEQLADAEASQRAPAANQAILDMLLSCLVADAPAQQFQPEDNQNMLGIDAEVMHEFADITVHALQQFFVALEASDNEQALKALKKWTRACNALEFSRLSNEISQLIQLVESHGVRDTGLSLNVFAQMIDQLKSLEELSGQDFSVSKLYVNFDAFYSQHYRNFLHALDQHLARCLVELNDNNALAEEDLDSLCEMIGEIIKFYKLFGFTASRDFLHYFNHVCRKSILGQYTLDVGIFATLYSVVQAHLGAVGNYSLQLEVEAQCQQLLAGFGQQLTQDDDRQFGRSQRLQALTDVLDIPTGYLDYIDNSEIEALEYCVSVGKTTALLLVDMEANHEWSERFVHWLNNTEIITSRTVFCEAMVDGRMQEYTKTSFLLVCDATADAIKQSLVQLSGSEKYIESLIFKIENTAEAAALAPQVPPQAAIMPAAPLATFAWPQSPKPVSNYAVDTGHSTHLTNIANTTGSALSAVAALPKTAALKTDAASVRQDKVDSNKSIRIGSDVIDRFVVQVGEMVLQRNMLSHAIHDKDVDGVLRKCKAILDSVHDESLNAAQMHELKASLGSLGEFFDGLVSANNKLTQSVSFVQEEVMSLRVVPIGIVFNRLPRIVRHINSEYGKDIQLDIAGEHVRVDKSMVDVLMEPLVHLVRNCADHGIESTAERQQQGKTGKACITVSAEQAGNVLYITVKDNGAGLNYAKIRDKAVQQGLMAANEPVDENRLNQMIFAPGFSTSATLTETSGRGVGMDAVKTSLAAIGGTIDVQSQQHEGTCFTLKLPITAAIQGVIVFRHQGETLTIPERNVVFGLTIPVSELQTVQGQATFIHQGDIIPVYGVGELLRWSAGNGKAAMAKIEQDILIITDDTYHIGLAVDKVIGRQEIFVRDLHRDLMSLPGVGGASILGNGEVVLILDCAALLKIASSNSQNIDTLLRVS